MKKTPRELYFDGKITAAEYVRLALQDNEYDERRQEIEKNFRQLMNRRKLSTAK